MFQKKENDLEEMEEYRRSIKDDSVGELIDKLIQLRISSQAKEDVTEKSKQNLKIRALKREINERFLKNENDEEYEESDGVSEVSSLLSI